MSEIPMYPDEIAACSDGPEKGVCPLCKRVVNGARLDGVWLPKRGDDDHARSCVYAYEPNRSALSRGNAVEHTFGPAELVAESALRQQLEAYFGLDNGGEPYVGGGYGVIDAECVIVATCKDKRVAELLVRLLNEWHGDGL